MYPAMKRHMNFKPCLFWLMLNKFSSFYLVSGVFGKSHLLSTSEFSVYDADHIYKMAIIIFSPKVLLKRKWITTPENSYIMRALQENFCSVPRDHDTMSVCNKFIWWIVVTFQGTLNADSMYSIGVHTNN